MGDKTDVFKTVADRRQCVIGRVLAEPNDAHAIDLGNVTDGARRVKDDRGVLTRNAQAVKVSKRVLRGETTSGLGEM